MESIEKKIDAIFFGLIILQTFDILLFASFAYANLRRLGEKFVKLINVVRLLVFFFTGLPPYVARLFRGAQFGGRKLCSWVNPFDANGIFKILHNPDW